MVLASDRMAPLEDVVADALGVGRFVSSDVIARALLRTAGREPLDDGLARPVADWFAALAEELGEVISEKPVDLGLCATRAARTGISRLRPHLALAVLVVLAPDQRVPAGPAKDVARACRPLVQRHLSGFCASVLRRWETEGLIINRKRPNPDQIPDVGDTSYADHPAGDWWNFPEED